VGWGMALVIALGGIVHLKPLDFLGRENHLAPGSPQSDDLELARSVAPFLFLQNPSWPTRLPYRLCSGEPHILAGTVFGGRVTQTRTVIGRYADSIFR
jgi:hypothetical protein